ncbi:MAG: hypothetical protein CMI32_03510 [Opitutales bacterium]|nr:hypothetical protein [Opitutales bacterium]|tara:strand:+ start:1459 stop:2025 length:567 start_codon:yes stop_codon:yes gene_type:complete
MKAALFSFSILLSILPVLLTAQTTPRNIGVVDVTKVFDEYYKVKIAKERMAKSQKIFREEMEIFQTELKKLVNEFNDLQIKLKNPSLDTEALRKQAKDKLKVIRDKEADVKQYQDRTRATLQQRERNLLVQHTGEIRSAITKVASARKLDLIFNSTDPQFTLGFVLFAKPTFDVTADIIAIVNASAPK